MNKEKSELKTIEKKVKMVCVPEVEYRRYKRQKESFIKIKVLLREAWQVLDQVE